jgi:REP element-mobilizing transposase RayT
MEIYKHYENSVGNNYKHVQITTKCRYRMMRKEKINVFCRVAIEEACKKHKIEIIILNVLENHAHMIVDCPRTMSDARLMQIIKGLSSYILFRICPNLRLRYPQGHFWNAGYFCCSVGNNFEMFFEYVKNQELHHAFH